MRLTLLARQGDGLRIKILVSYAALAKFGFALNAVTVVVGFFLTHNFVLEVIAGR